MAIVVLGRNGLWHMLAIDVLVYALVPFVLFARSLAFRTRAWVLVVCLCAIGALSLVLAGFRTAGPVWLSMAALSAGLLVSVRAGIGVVVANVVLFAAVGVGVSRGVMPWASGVEDAIGLWMLSATNTTMLGLLSAVSVGVLITGLQREAEARVRAEAERRRGQHLEALGTLAGGIAHDFNNLLAPILANVELLESEVTDDQRELLDDIRTSAERGRDLVRRLLMLRKGEVAQHDQCDLAEAAQEVARLVRSRAAPGVRIEVRVTPAPRVRASLAELHQIVMNLATNGVQAMPTSGILTIEVDAAAVNRRLVTRLRVRDTGAGMSPETLARAFDPFFTTKSAQEGTGLGLATVRALLIALGGTIDIDSAPGKGTLVTICFPGVVTGSPHDSPVNVVAPPPSAPRLRTPVLPRALDAGRPRPKPRTVLIVDDEPVVLETSRRVVSALGHLAVPMATPVEAESWFAAHASGCDLVLTDYRMPGKTGTQLVAALRRRRPELPAVVVSGFVAEAAREVHLLGSGTALLAKPYGVDELREAIETACPALAERL